MTACRRLRVPWIAGAVAFACANPPPPVVEEVRAELAAAEARPDVGQHGSLELYEAQQSVQRLERAAERDADDADQIDQLAYLAKRRIEIAEQAGEAGAYRAQLEELGEQRDAAQLQARTREAERAQGLAQIKSQEAASALERAKQLEAELSDLKAEQTERGVVLSMSDVLFAFDRAQLQPGAERSLSDVARFLNEFPSRSVDIEGHTDDVGSADYNQALSQERAQAVADFLRGAGVERSRIRVRGFGESQPVAPNDTESGRQQNRRVEIILDESRASRG